MTVPLRPRRVPWLIGLFCSVAVAFLRAETVTLFPVADATLIELWPSNSMGAGNWISSGTTQNGTSNRALIQFDVAAAVPAGATVTDVGLYVWVTRTPVDGNTDSVFSLRRMLRAWGEGANPTPSTSPGFGLPALAGDATWSHSFWNTNGWTAPGGLEGTDYSDAISSSAGIAGVSSEPYFFESGGALGDVQFWLDHPESNFGWMLKTEDELSRFTARRFGSRELQDPAGSPQLVITYLPPVRIHTIHAASNQVTLSFNADIGYSYAVEVRAGFSETNLWTLLTNLGLAFTSGPRTAIDLQTNTQRFYRLRRD